MHAIVVGTINARMANDRMFGEAPQSGERNWGTLGIGLAAVAAVVIALIIASVRGRNELQKPVNPNQPSPAAAYAANLPLSDIKMSQADIGTGGQIYYITGKVTNNGDKTVSGALVELVFRNGMGQLVQRENEPLRIVVATEPALDVADLARVPMKPGQSREFQIPVEHISQQWDGQYPTLTIVRVQT
jgi:hypothetical protein